MIFSLQGFLFLAFLLEHIFRFLILCCSKGRLISGACCQHVMTAASELLLSEEPAALASLAQPLHRLVKDRRRGSGRRPAKCSSGWQDHAAIAPTHRPPSASNTPVRPARIAGEKVCVCVCLGSLVTKEDIWGTCASQRCSGRADGRSELLVQNLAWGARCHAQKQCTIILSRVLPL